MCLMNSVHNFHLTFFIWIFVVDIVHMCWQTSLGQITNSMSAARYKERFGLVIHLLGQSKRKFRKSPMENISFLIRASWGWVSIDETNWSNLEMAPAKRVNDWSETDFNACNTLRCCQQKLKFFEFQKLQNFNCHTSRNDISFSFQLNISVAHHPVQSSFAIILLA